MSKNKDAAHDEHRPDVGLYVKVFGALMFLTFLTVLISKFHLPRPQAIALGLFVAAIKGTLVASIFMHLWGESKVIHKALLITVACGAILVIPMIDFVLLSPKMVNHADVASQRPNEGGEASEAHVETVTETVTLPAPTPTPAPAPKKKGKH